MHIDEKKVKLEDKYVRWFSETSKNMVGEVGGKAANLGEMLKIGIPVPQGFSVTAEAYSEFLEKTKIGKQIYELLEDLDVENTNQLEETAKKIREIIEKTDMPEEIEKEIIEAYDVLSFDEKDLKNASRNVLTILKMSEPRFVAVRSSATAEDSESASFAGQQETFLNVKGKSELIKSVIKCWASLFTARSIYYRVKKGFKHDKVLIAVIVQIMIDSDKSGVIFSQDPITKKENVVIEAVYGLGEGIVSGKIKPDKYVVSRDYEIIGRNISEKKIAITRNSAGETETIRLTEDRSRSQVLNNYEIKRLAAFAVRLEEHYKIPQDIEFAIDSNDIYIVQTRPITTLAKDIEKKEISGKILLSGEPASPGIASGKVKIIRDIRELGKIKKGDILVTKMTNPDMVVTMQKSAGIITDEGGATAHAAIVSREMGIPAVVGTEKATKILKDDMIVTINGFNGKIYSGKAEDLAKSGAIETEHADEKTEILPAVQTKTKIKVMVDLPSFAERAAKTQIREVGLLRLEGIIAESGKHPLGFLKSGNMKEYENLIFSGINKIGEHFDKLWIRTSDIRSDEFRNLDGASKEKESNPMMGMHGIRAGLKKPEILKAELRAMKRLSEKNKQVGVLLPQIISADEVQKVKEILNEIESERKLKLGVMIETPASVQVIEDLCESGIDFISFGTNDLTQYTLAVDRNNESVQYLYDEMNLAVLSQLAYVINICKQHNVETSICGQAGSKKEMVEFLIKKGIDSISVNADKAKEISEFVKELEEKLGIEGIEQDSTDMENQKSTIEGRQEEKNTGIKEKPKQKEEIITERKSEDEQKKRIKRDKHGRKLYDITCSKCRRESSVPFKPKPGRTLFCKKCYKENKNKINEIKEKTVASPPLKSDNKEISKDLPKSNIKEQASELPDNKQENQKSSQKTEEEKKNEFPETNFGFDVFGSREKENQKEQIEKMNNLEHVEEKIEDKIEQVEERKEEQEKKNQEIEENIKITKEEPEKTEQDTINKEAEDSAVSNIEEQAGGDEQLQKEDERKESEGEEREDDEDLEQALEEKAREGLLDDKRGVVDMEEVLDIF